MLFALTLAFATGLVAVLLTQADNSRLTPVRTLPRPRRTVSPQVYAAASRLGFRYSASRDALVLRGVGRRRGPVLKLAEAPAAPASAPLLAQDPAIGARRVVDVVCMPVRHLRRAQPLWQLTAVDVDARFVWSELAPPREEGPPPRMTATFMRRIKRDLERRGLRLDAIVVGPDSDHRGPLLAAAHDSGTQMMKPPARMRQERIAAQTHARILSTFWRHAVAPDATPSLSELRRGLRSWVNAHNSEPSAGGRRNRSSPTAVLGESKPPDRT